jgi:hypothetical protein
MMKRKVSGVTIACADHPEETVELSPEKVLEFRQTIMDELTEKSVDVSQLSRRNIMFIKAHNVVEILDRRGFAWPEVEGLDAEWKYGIVVWLSRAWMGLRKSYQNTRPMFVEVY